MRASWKAKTVIHWRPCQDLSSSASSVSLRALPQLCCSSLSFLKILLDPLVCETPPAYRWVFLMPPHPQKKTFLAEFSFKEALHSPWHCPNQLHPHPRLFHPLHRPEISAKGKAVSQVQIQPGLNSVPNDIFRVFCGKHTVPARPAKAMVVSLGVS